MKRTLITLEAIADRKNLLEAFQKAAKGKRYRNDVQSFMRDFDRNLNRLGEDIRTALLPYGKYRSFQIHDPKKRVIHAACFEDRIFHHALMNVAGDVLERAMTSTSYACRPNKGVHKAAKKVQQHLRHYAYFTQIDISGYFAAIEHKRLLQILERRFKGAECSAQLERIISSHQANESQGLPIGSLTSQYFANYYLDGLDRLLASLPTVRANIRYMDDIIWWSDSRNMAQESLCRVKNWLQQERACRLSRMCSYSLVNKGERFVVFVFCQVQSV